MKAELDTLNASLITYRVMQNTMEKIEIILDKSGYSYAELGAKLGVSKSRIHDWRRGLCKPSRDNAIMLYVLSEQLKGLE